MRRLETSRGQREGDMEKNDDEKGENKDWMVIRTKRRWGQRVGDIEVEEILRKG